MQRLHDFLLNILPDSQLWFLDGKDEGGKVVANPNIGYGLHTITYADGKTREFFRVGISANTKGISVYLFGFNDKTYLSKTYGSIIGKASVTGYCIRFKNLNEINMEVLKVAVMDGVKQGQ